MLLAWTKDASLDSPNEFRETLVSRSSAMDLEIREDVAAKCDVLVFVLRAEGDDRLPEACVVKVEQIILGECFDTLRWAIKGGQPMHKGSDAEDAQRSFCK